MSNEKHSSWPKLGAILALGAALWLLPVPRGLSPQCWHLFAIFMATIVAVVVKALPVFVAAIRHLPHAWHGVALASGLSRHAIEPVHGGVPSVDRWSCAPRSGEATWPDSSTS